MTRKNAEAMSQYQIQSVWPEPDLAVRDEVIRFWVDEGAMTEGAAQERIPQLLMVCRLASDRSVVAVSTVFPHFVDSLQLHCFAFRAFVGRNHRTVGLRSTKLIQDLMRQSYDFLNGRYQDGLDPNVVGFYLDVHNASVIRHRRELIWTDLGANLVYIGPLPNGRQARVWYFENAAFPS